MVGAGAAAALELPAEGLAGPIHAHGRVVGGDPRLRGEVPHGHAIELHPAEDRGVFRLESVQERSHAGTHRAHQLLVGRRLHSLRLGGHALEGAPLGPAAPVVIGEGVAQQPVEPGDRGVLVAQRPGSGEAPHEGLLQEVFRHLAGADPAREEAEEARGCPRAPAARPPGWHGSSTWPDRVSGSRIAAPRRSVHPPRGQGREAFNSRRGSPGSHRALRTGTRRSPPRSLGRSWVCLLGRRPGVSPGLTHERERHYTLPGFAKGGNALLTGRAAGGMMSKQSLLKQGSAAKPPRGRKAHP